MLYSPYLLLLSITFVAIHILRRTSKEIPSTITALTTVLSFFWGFFLAPWPVKLIIVALLTRLDKFYLRETKFLG